MTKRLILAAVLVLSTLAGAFGVASAQDTPAVGEYAGVVESFDGTTLMVSGLTFQADTADIDDSVTMQVGELVEVKFVASAGALTAYNVDDVEVGDDAIATVGEITGSLEMVDAASAVIAGLTFDISHARVDDNVVLVSGTLVEIDFIYNASLFGFRISAGDPEDLNDPFDDMDDDDETASITGAIEALDATSMTVAGLVFNIATAHIDDDGTLAWVSWSRSSTLSNRTDHCARWMSISRMMTTPTTAMTMTAMTTMRTATTTISAAWCSRLAAR